MENKESLITHFGFIYAAMGRAMGVGNIWRFPRVAAENGGGSFVVAYMVALLVWSLPLIIAEKVMGRKTRKGTVGAFRKMMGEEYAWMGGFVAFVCFALGAYYSVIMGWTLRYFLYGITGVLRPGVNAEALWDNFMVAPLQGVLFHGIAVAMAAFVVFRGDKGGIEKVYRIIITIYFVLLIMGMIRAITLPGAIIGLNYLFSLDFSQLLSGKVWLDAFTQSAWSTGAGWGLIMTYSVHNKGKEDVAFTGFIKDLLNTFVVFMASMAIIPTVFALAPQSIEKSVAASNTGLTFICLARLFAEMPGGTAIGTLFFLTMSLTALTILRVVYEVVMRNFMDVGWNRKKAATLVVAASFLAGLPSAVNVEFLKNQDQVWGVALLVSGLFISLALAKYGLKRACLEDINPESIIIGWWEHCIRLFPMMFAVVCSWGFYQQFIWYPNTWWNPFETYSPMTIFVQWSLVITALIANNKTLAESIRSINLGL